MILADIRLLPSGLHFHNPGNAQVGDGTGRRAIRLADVKNFVFIARAK
jgi:hypothetical protein